MGVGHLYFSYNLLNLPKRVTTSGSDSLLNYKTYNYDATGQRLQVKSFANGSTTHTEDYIGNKIYKNSSLSKVLIPEEDVFNCISTSKQ